ncbi:MAG: VPLPA-CTERM sorting domain-containing protein [Pseudomonadota bacterium]|nr:VPLPA-CTERM sorting domain-containing protein [Pseudomonadota bacterium]
MRKVDCTRLIWVACLSFAGAAHADYVSVLGSGSITAPASVEFGDRTDTHLTLHAGAPLTAPYNFIDAWQFTLTGSANVTSLTSAFSFLNTFGIQNLQVNLFDVSNNILAVGWQNVIPLDPPANTSLYSLSLTPQTGLSAGAYELRVRGTLLAPPGSYAGTLTATASVVPLPAAFPLLLMGLSAFGAVGTRKRKSAIVAA